MEFDYFGNNNEDSAINKNRRHLLSNGWRAFQRDFDLGFFWQVLWNDTHELNKKTIDLLSYYADALGRTNYSWWSNILNVASDYTRSEFEKYWNYITPAPLTPDYRYKDVLATETPIVQLVSRNSIPIDYVLNRLQEITVLRILEILGRPDVITQYYSESDFFYPVDKFTTWERIDVLNTVYAYWSEYDVWLQMNPYDRSRRQYTLMAVDLKPLINKATYDLAMMLSGYKTRVGKVHNQFSINCFPKDIQEFSDTVQQTILNQKQLAVLVHGEPGTGKTAWTQAVAKEILVPLGFVIFILDYDAVTNFIPPTYLENICLIINEADNLAQDRASEVAQNNNRTEHILSLLDGTLYQSVIDDAGIQMQQRLVVLMTCNTTERLDRAMLRKGRVDLIYEFIHKFV
jgi:hypothetical protein